MDQGMEEGEFPQGLKPTDFAELMYGLKLYPSRLS
jgi:hypothetical protein